MLKAIFGLLLGATIGGIAPAFTLNVKVVSVVLIASFDALLGGLKAKIKSNFDDKIMLGGFLINLTAALILVYLGDYLNVKLHYIVLFAFSLRIFKNLSVIGKYILKKL